MNPTILSRSLGVRFVKSVVRLSNPRVVASAEAAVLALALAVALAVGRWSCN